MKIVFSFTAPVLQVAQQGSLRSVAFSPVDPTIVASAGHQSGTKLYDIRQNTFR